MAKMTGKVVSRPPQPGLPPTGGHNLGFLRNQEDHCQLNELTRLPQLEPVFNQFRRISTGERHVRDWFD